LTHAFSLVPAPLSVVPGTGPSFVFAPGVSLVTGPSPDEISLGVLAADLIGRDSGFPLELLMGLDGVGPALVIVLDADAGPRAADVAERYCLTVTHESVALRAPRVAGLVRGLATLRQLVTRGESGLLEVAAVVIEDAPRFAWRGLSLDVVRHFLSVEDVLLVLEIMADHKLNVLHLHLTDDQGWRIALATRPLLTERSAQSEVGDGPGGFYTAEDYATLLAFAAARHITIVPEIDIPGHVNAALHAYAELTPSGIAPAAYTGIEVGFSRLHRDVPATRAFLTDVFTELAELTPGAYVHLGGDEVEGLEPDERAWFVRTVSNALRAAGKTPVGWQEIAGLELEPGTVVQYWDTRLPAAPMLAAAAAGARVLLSPGSRVYLDMKYDASTTLGLDWAGYVELRDSYDWEPAELIEGLPLDAIIGVEAALWTETITTRDELTLMLLPRLAAVAEVAWSVAENRDWERFRARVAGLATRWDDAGVVWRRSPQVDWPAGRVPAVPVELATS